MSIIDKNKAMVAYICECPQIRDNPLFFNFLNAEDNDKQFVTQSTDRNIERPYIDGSVLKRYAFTIMDYRAVTYQALVKDGEHPNKNVEELLDVQGIIDWIEEQDDEGNYPDFGEGCIIDSIKTTSANPNLNSVNTAVTPALAKYSITIQVDYLDNNKKIFS